MLLPTVDWRGWVTSNDAESDGWCGLWTNATTHVQRRCRVSTDQERIYQSPGHCVLQVKCWLFSYILTVVTLQLSIVARFFLSPVLHIIWWSLDYHCFILRLFHLTFEWENKRNVHICCLLIYLGLFFSLIPRYSSPPPLNYVIECLPPNCDSIFKCILTLKM